MGASVAMLAISAASAYSQYAASNAQADNSVAAQMQNYWDMRNQQQVQSNQVTTDASIQMSNRAIKAAEDLARIKNVAADGGVAGLSVDHLMNDARFQQNMDNQGIQKQAQNRQVQIAQEGRGRAAQTMSNINAANNQRKTALDTGLQIASAYGSYKQSTQKASSSSVY